MDAVICKQEKSCCKQNQAASLKCPVAMDPNGEVERHKRDSSVMVAGLTSTQSRASLLPNPAAIPTLLLRGMDEVCCPSFSLPVLVPHMPPASMDFL